MNSISYKASDHRDSDDDAQEITNFFLKIPTDCKKQTPRTLKSTYGRISFINACLRVQGMFQGYVGFVLENYLRPECPIQDMDRLKPESLTLLLDEFSICKSNWSLQQNEGTNLSKVRVVRKKKSHLLRLCISLNCNKKCHSLGKIHTLAIHVPSFFFKVIPPGRL